MMSLWKEFHFEGSRTGWDPKTFQHTSLPVVLKDSESTPYYDINFERNVTYDLAFAHVDVRHPQKTLDGLSISAPLQVGNVWTIQWEVDWDFAEFGLKAGEFFELQIKAEMLRNTKEFPKFDPKKQHSMTIRADDILKNVQTVVEYFSNPEYRVWIGYVVGFVKPRVQDHAIEIVFTLSIEQGDVPPGYMEFIMFLTLRTLRPQLTVSLPGLDFDPEDYLEQSFVRRAFAREM